MGFILLLLVLLIFMTAIAYLISSYDNSFGHSLCVFYVSFVFANLHSMHSVAVNNIILSLSLRKCRTIGMSEVPLCSCMHNISCIYMYTSSSKLHAQDFIYINVYLFSIYRPKELGSLLPCRLTL